MGIERIANKRVMRALGVFLGVAGVHTHTADATESPQSKSGASAIPAFELLPSVRSLKEMETIYNRYTGNLARYSERVSDVKRLRKSDIDRWKFLLGTRQPDASDRDAVERDMRRQIVRRTFLNILVNITRVEARLPVFDALTTLDEYVKKIDGKTISFMSVANEQFEEFFNTVDQELQDHVYTRVILFNEWKKRNEQRRKNMPQAPGKQRSRTG